MFYFLVVLARTSMTEKQREKKQTKETKNNCVVVSAGFMSTAS